MADIWDTLTNITLHSDYFPPDLDADFSVSYQF